VDRLKDGAAARIGAVAGVRGRRAPIRKTLQKVADLLGTDADSLKTQLSSGRSMSDLASAAGVGSEDLLATIGTGIADQLEANPDVSAQLAAEQNRGALVDGSC
jgi:hypothetical protein